LPLDIGKVKISAQRTRREKDIMKANSQRRLIPKEKIIVVKNTKKIDFTKKYKFIYFDWWFELLILPFFLICIALAALGALYFSLRVTGREHLRNSSQKRMYCCFKSLSLL